MSTSSPPYACPASMFAPVAGELIPFTPSQNGRRQAVAVMAQVFTTKAVPYQTYLANLKTDPNATLALTPPTGSVTVYEGSTPVGTASLAAGVLTTIALSLSPGTHTLTATYSGDANYPGFSFGKYTLTVLANRPLRQL